MKSGKIISAGIFLVTLTLSSGYSGTVNYSDVSGLNYDFTNIKEVSALDTFLGAPRPAPNPAIDTLVITGGTLQVLTASSASPGSTNVFQHAATTYSFDITSKLNTTSIDKLKISLSGQYALNTVNLGNTNNYASVSVQIPMTIQLLAASGIAIDGAPQKSTGTTASSLPTNFVFDPLFPQYSYSLNGIGNINFNNSGWSATWENNDSLAQIFSLPAMKITQLSLSITPDLAAFRSFSDQNTASVTLTNASFQVVPEPTSTSLFVLGSSILLLRRRKKPLDS